MRQLDNRLVTLAPGYSCTPASNEFGGDMAKTAIAPAPLATVKGKVAFITGGSSGIGLGLGRVLSAAGMKVVFTYRSTAHRDAALASFPKGNPGVHAIGLDTADRDAMVSQSRRGIVCA